MLPRAYQRWVGDWLSIPIPEERLATCDNCAMAPPPGTPERSLHEFFGANKCCTYFPSLPNFSVGGILGDAELVEGARRVAARIAGGTGVDPLAVRAEKKRIELYRIGARAGFGRAETFKCPYFIDGASASCSVWSYREAVCSTYYCKFNAPVRGREFWNELKALLSTIEMTVSVHAAMELGVAAPTIDLLLAGNTELTTAADVDGVHDPKRHAELWGDWAGRETAYYLECARIANELDLAAIRRLGGMMLERRLTSARVAFEGILTLALPDRLRIAPTLQVGAAPSPGKVRVMAGPSQPIEMPAMVVELLSHFHGQTVDEAMATLSAQGFETDRDFLTKLWKFGFLVADQ
jgi:hypothetical protein